MSRYDDGDKDDMIFELEEFLKTHEISELLALVHDAVENKEDGYLET